MKIKNLRIEKAPQITFDSDKHPTSGIVSTYSWKRLRELLNNGITNNIESIRITKQGLDIFWKEFF